MKSLADLVQRCAMTTEETLDFARRNWPSIGISLSGLTFAALVRYGGDEAGSNILRELAVYSVPAGTFFTSYYVARERALRSRLEELSITDPLTGLHNKRFLMQYGDVLMRTAARNKQDLPIIIGDVDYFKLVNDVLGHDFGDLVLKDVARLISESAKRASDIKIRYGGDEYLIVLQDTSQSGAELIIQGIEENVKPYFEDLNQKLQRVAGTKGMSIGVAKVGISIGYAMASQFNYRLEEVFKAADTHLYTQKRNR